MLCVHQWLLNVNGQKDGIVVWCDFTKFGTVSAIELNNALDALKTLEGTNRLH